MEDNLDLRKIVGTIADEERFRTIAAVSLGADTPEKIAALTELSNAIVMKSIVKLEGVGLIGKNDGKYKFNFGTLQALNRAFSQSIPKKPVLTGIDRFFKNGKLVTYPKDNADKMAVLKHIIGLFEPSHEYTEKEVNEKLQEVNSDFASFRRHLIDNGFFKRERTTDENGYTVTIYRRLERR